MLERWKPHLVKWRGGWQVARARSEDNRTITDNRVWEVENTRKETGEWSSQILMSSVCQTATENCSGSDSVCVCLRRSGGRDEDTKRWRPESRWKMETFTVIFLGLLSAGHQGFLINHRTVDRAEICPSRGRTEFRQRHEDDVFPFPDEESDGVSCYRWYVSGSTVPGGERGRAMSLSNTPAGISTRLKDDLTRVFWSFCRHGVKSKYTFQTWDKNLSPLPMHMLKYTPG